MGPAPPFRYLPPGEVARAKPALERERRGRAVVEPLARRPAPPPQEPPRDGGRRGDPPALPRRGLRRRAGHAAVHEDQIRPPKRGALAGVRARHRTRRARTTLADALLRERVSSRRPQRPD